MQKQYDVIIVGSGPAGAIAAYELAKRGVKPLILEKETLPRYKTCGGSIQFKVTKYLPFDISSVVEDVIYGVIFSHQFQDEFNRKSDEPLMYCVMRDRFDSFLVNKAIEQGAILIDGQRVTEIQISKEQVIVTTIDYELSCQVIIGADGANSIVAKSLNLMQGVPRSLGIQSEITVDEKILFDQKGYARLDWGTLPSGYAWLFPKAKQFSVGVGGPIIIGRELKSYYSRFREYLNLLNSKTNSFRGHLLPFRPPKMSICKERGLLVGDAAGLIDAFTGEGIFQAIISSQMAASVVYDYLNKKSDNLSKYEELIDIQLMPELLSARLCLHLFNCFSRRFHIYMKTHERPWNAFCRILRGEKTFRSIKNELGPFQFLWDPIDKITTMIENQRLSTFGIQ
ncbi:MAG: geranylgeranyl reductase family protein [bacterium]|nr:geranylgeranyl reductase family protein [bacterium]